MTKQNLLYLPRNKIHLFQISKHIDIISLYHCKISLNVNVASAVYDPLNCRY